MDWKSIVKTVAPTLATALGGPLSGAAVSILSNAILGTNGTENDVSEAILRGLTPEAQLALRKADQDFAVQVQTLANDAIKTYMDDVQDARKHNSSNQNIVKLAYIILSIFAAIMACALVFSLLKAGDINPAESALTGAVVGYVAGLAQQVVGFFFGSSSSSDKKTDAMADAIKKIGN
jgi:VIT1/CCC1 family predicted Fe2+/Mn2+ transporter